MKKNTKQIVITALFSALTCILSVITIPIPFSPVPFTLSLLAVFLSGSFLPPVFAFLSQIVYLIIGAVGIPVFSGFRGGLSVFVGPTGGFLIAYPLMAMTVALFVRFARKHSFLFPLLGMISANIICYILGTAVYCFSTNSDIITALSVTVLPFIIFDLIKAIIASSIRLSIIKRTK